MYKPPSSIVFAITALAVLGGLPDGVRAQTEDVPAYLSDRGSGMPTSMFGTYIRKGDLLIYPFFEYYLDDNTEYKPSELGFGLDSDYRGKFRGSEGIFFIGYGLTDWLAVEMEAAVIDARLEKDPNDPSSMPAKFEESGVGDIEGQIRWRWARESTSRPEFFGFFEAVSPRNKDKPLIGTADWELKSGVGLIKGFPWGTLTVRGSGQYEAATSLFDFGEYAVEYLKRLSPAWRVYAGVEGTQDEIGLITEAQWHFTDSVYLKLNNAVGITSKATDWAPEIGIMFRLPVGAR